MIARQPHGNGICLLKWLPGSLVVLLCGLVLPALGWEIDGHDPVAPALNAVFEDMPEIFDELSLPPALEIDRTMAWHEDLIQILRHQGASRELLRAPVPSAEAVCMSLETVLPSFDLAADDLPEPLRQRLCKRVHTYAVRHHRDVQAMLHRADDHLPLIKRTLREYGLPTYYAYLPLVESAFQPDALHGGSGARGLWQLLRGTARAHGLTVSETVDERLHPKRSTEAAVDYLAYLYKRFGDYGPLYVLAAYNYGETNLSRKMRRFGPPSIAALYRRGYVPAETREYLLRMMTMWIITAQPGRFHLLLRDAADPSLLPRDRVPRSDAPVGVAEDDGAKR